MIKQEISAHRRPSDEASPIPGLSMEHLDRLTLEAFYALLEDVDLHEVFEEFVVHAKPHRN